MDLSASRWSRAWAWVCRWGWVLVPLAWAAVTWRARPRDVFEWDEFLFLRALDHFDVSEHRPHPPGAPPYCFIGWLLRVALGDGQRALQLLSVAAGALGLVLLWRLVAKESGNRAVAWGAACGLAAFPGFLFYSGVGLTDVPAVAAMVAVWGLCFATLDRPRLLPWVAVIAALALGIRPAVLPALVPAGLAVIVQAVRQRRWRDLGLALGAGVAMSAVIWVPAILVTGPRRYLEALRLQAEWVAGRDAESAFPEAPFRTLARYWVQVPFGHRRLARLVWGLAILGSVAWWRAGRRRIVGMVGGGGLLYLLVAVGTLNYHWGVRYGLPLLPVLAVMAVGNLLWRPLAARWLAGTAALFAATLMVVQTAPVLAMRRRPAPVRAAFAWVQENCEPDRTWLVWGPDVAPHAEWWVRRLGFQGEMWSRGSLLLRQTAAGRRVVLVTTEPAGGLETVFERTWDSPRLLELWFGRYGTAVVQLPPEGIGRVITRNLEMGSQSWLLKGPGRLELPPSTLPQTLELCPITAAVQVKASGSEREVQPGECADLLLLPGVEGGLTLLPDGPEALLRPLAFGTVAGAWEASSPLDVAKVRRFPFGNAWVVPVAAHLKGVGGAVWRSDLVIHNQGGVAGGIVIARLPGGRGGGALPAIELALPAAESISLDDILARPELEDGTTSGALLVGLDVLNPEVEAEIGVESRTYDLRVAGGPSDGLIQAVSCARGLRQNELALIGEVEVMAGSRLAVGAAAIGSVPATALVTAMSGDREVARHELRLPALGHLQHPWSLPAGRYLLRVTVSRGDAATLVFPYVSVVDRAGRARYLTVSGARSTRPSQAVMVTSQPLR